VQASALLGAAHHSKLSRASYEHQIRMLSAAAGKRVRTSNASYLAPFEPAQPPVAVGSRALTQHAPGQLTTPGASCTRSKAQSALPSNQSGAAAAEYGSRKSRFLAPAWSTSSPWSSSRSERGAGGVFGSSVSHQPRVNPRARPNPSLKLTRYGRPCKPGPRQSYYRRGPGLQALPPRAA
jgi:hypothetical protein